MGRKSLFGKVRQIKMTDNEFEEIKLTLKEIRGGKRGLRFSSCEIDTITGNEITEDETNTERILHVS